MNRQEVLEFINNVIEEEHGMAVTEDSLLTDCNIDSFGYAILWLSIEGKLEDVCGVERLLGKEYIDNLSYETFTVQDLIDDIEKRLANVSKVI